MSATSSSTPTTPTSSSSPSSTAASFVAATAGAPGRTSARASPTSTCTRWERCRRARSGSTCPQPGDSSAATTSPRAGPASRKACPGAIQRHRAIPTPGTSWRGILRGCSSPGPTARRAFGTAQQGPKASCSSATMKANTGAPPMRDYRRRCAGWPPILPCTPATPTWSLPAWETSLAGLACGPGRGAPALSTSAATRGDSWAPLIPDLPALEVLHAVPE